MRVLIALDKMRGTFTAPEACALVARGVRQADPAIEVEELPLADGGEGTLEAILVGGGGERHRLRVTGPLGDPLEAEYGIAPDGAAIIESARICGLALVPPDRRSPLDATSAGIGEAIAACLDAGVGDFLIGLGGTATVDGGAGMIRALGFQLHGPAGALLRGTPRDLATLSRIDGAAAHPGLATARFLALADVDNPLTGPTGSVAVYAPQKGAAPSDLPVLERGLEAIGSAAAAWTGVPRTDLVSMPSGGAAGGLGLACAAFLGARLAAGGEFVMERLDFAGRLARADLVVTGEGAFDAQSLHGKVAARVLEAAARRNRPAALVAGRWDGSLPAPRPERLKVFAGADRTAGEGMLDAAALVEIGRQVGAWAQEAL